VEDLGSFFCQELGARSQSEREKAAGRKAAGRGMGIGAAISSSSRVQMLRRAGSWFVYFYTCSHGGLSHL